MHEGSRGPMTVVGCGLRPRRDCAPRAADAVVLRQVEPRLRRREALAVRRGQLTCRSIVAGADLVGMAPGGVRVLAQALRAAFRFAGAKRLLGRVVPGAYLAARGSGASRGGPMTAVGYGLRPARD